MNGGNDACQAGLGQPRLIRAGKRRINPTFLIQAFEWDGSPEARDLTPGGVKVVMLVGEPFVVDPSEAPAFLRTLDRFVVDGPEPTAPGPPSVIGSVEYDPQTGQPLR